MLEAVAGSNAVRAGEAADAVDGVQPAAVVEPDSAETVARVLAAAAAARISVVVRGGGTKLGWGRTPAAIDVVLSTRRLSRVVSHAHGDLTAEVEAGTTLDVLNSELSKRAQWLPLESAFPEATIGGVLGTNDSGPAQHRFGTPRDLLIGVQLATTDGRLVKAGGNVVKNVAGYDLGKLVTGSFGSLAVVVRATFKLLPMAPAIATTRVRFAEPLAGAAAAHAVAASQLDPVALEIHARAGGSATGEPPVEIAVRFASTPVVVDAEVAKTARLMQRFECEPLPPTRDAEDDAWWRAYGERPWEGTGAVARISWLPAALEGVLTLVNDLGRTAPRVELTGRAGLGVGLLRVDGDGDTQLEAVRRLRERGDLLRQVTVLRAAPLVKGAIDVWGGPAGTATMHQAIKRAFDPAGILNAGRGPV
jgi:glycolate oxidase FAD binding subunit